MIGSVIWTADETRWDIYSEKQGWKQNWKTEPTKAHGPTNSASALQPFCVQNSGKSPHGVTITASCLWPCGTTSCFLWLENAEAAEARILRHQTLMTMWNEYTKQPELSYKLNVELPGSVPAEKRHHFLSEMIFMQPFHPVSHICTFIWFSTCVFVCSNLVKIPEVLWMLNALCSYVTSVRYGL